MLPVSRSEIKKFTDPWTLLGQTARIAIHAFLP